MCLFDTCLCIIILTFLVSMKLGKAVTYPGLEGVFFFKNICVCIYIYLAAPDLSCGTRVFIFCCGVQDF